MTDQTKPLGRARRILLAPFRRRRWIYLLIALFVLPWLWIRLFTPGPGPVDLPDLVLERTWPVYVIVQDWHCAIVVEQPRGWDRGQPEAPRSRFVEYAWGDRGFYMDSDFALPSLFNAALMPSQSVVYLRSMEAPPDKLYADIPVYRRDVGTDLLRALILTCEEAFVRTPDGRREAPFPPVSSYRGRFYPGRQSYIFWSSCNTWVLSRLKDAGFDVSPLGVITADQVPGRLTGFQRVE